MAGDTFSTRNEQTDSGDLNALWILDIRDYLQFIGVNYQDYPGEL